MYYYVIWSFIKVIKGNIGRWVIVFIVVYFFRFYFLFYLGYDEIMLILLEGDVFFFFLEILDFLSGSECKYIINLVNSVGFCGSDFYFDKDFD